MLVPTFSSSSDSLEINSEKVGSDNAQKFFKLQSLSERYARGSKLSLNLDVSYEK